MRRRRILRDRRNIIIASALIIIAVTLIIVRYAVFTSNTPDQITITVAWNPGSIADDMVRAMIPSMDSQVTLQNITGANGADGANEVFRSERNGTHLLSTSLSAFVTSEAMGFSEASHNEWTAWLCAFAPVIVVTAGNSPYNDMDGLLTDIRHNPGRVRCADDGAGTAGFIAAELFSSGGNLEIDHISFSGSNSVITALEGSEADFAILLSVQVIDHLRSGRLKALGSFTKEEITLYINDTEIMIPSAAGLNDRFDSILPLGEYYGIFIPADTSQAKSNSIETIIKKSVASDLFNIFTSNAGLINVTPDKSKNAETIESFCSTVCWTLYDVGYLPVNPDTLGIQRKQ